MNLNQKNVTFVFVGLFALGLILAPWDFNDQIMGWKFQKISPAFFPPHPETLEDAYLRALESINANHPRQKELAELRHGLPLWEDAQPETGKLRLDLLGLEWVGLAVCYGGLLFALRVEGKQRLVTFIFVGVFATTLILAPWEFKRGRTLSIKVSPVFYPPQPAPEVRPNPNGSFDVTDFPLGIPVEPRKEFISRSTLRRSSLVLEWFGLAVCYTALFLAFKDLAHDAKPMPTDQPRNVQ